MTPRPLAFAAHTRHTGGMPVTIEQLRQVNELYLRYKDERVRLARQFAIEGGTDKDISDAYGISRGGANHLVNSGSDASTGRRPGQPRKRPAQPRKRKGTAA